MPKRYCMLIKRNMREESSDEESMQLPKLFKKPDVYIESNHLYFRGEVNAKNVGEFCDILDKYNQEILNVHAQSRVVITFPCPLYVHITSFGGDLLSGFMAHDYIKRSNLTVYTVAEGYTISSGSIMFMAGKKRLMTRNSYFLAHQLRQTVYGVMKASDFADEAKNDEEMMERINRIYISNLHVPENTSPNDLLTKEKLEAHMKHELYWNYETCMKYGIIDGEYINVVDCDKNDRTAIIDTMQTHLVDAQPIAVNSIKMCNLKPSKKILEIISELRADEENEKEALAKQLGKMLGKKQAKVKTKKEKNNA